MTNNILLQDECEEYPRKKQRIKNSPFDVKADDSHNSSLAETEILTGDDKNNPSYTSSTAETIAFSYCEDFPFDENEEKFMEFYWEQSKKPTYLSKLVDALDLARDIPDSFKVIYISKIFVNGCTCCLL